MQSTVANHEVRLSRLSAVGCHPLGSSTVKQQRPKPSIVKPLLIFPLGTGYDDPLYCCSFSLRHCRARSPQPHVVNGFTMISLIVFVELHLLCALSLQSLTPLQPSPQGAPQQSEKLFVYQCSYHSRKQSRSAHNFNHVFDPTGPLSEFLRCIKAINYLL